MRRSFIQRLDKVGLISWRLEARSTIGMFFVRTKEGHIRLVFDCRPTNELRQEPPKCRLATSGALNTLCLYDEWASMSAEKFGGQGRGAMCGGRFD